MSALKKINLAALGVMGMASIATAADLPSRGAALAPVPVFAATKWTGFYVGAHLGWAQHNGNLDAFTPFNGFAGFPVTGLKSSSVMGGVQAGYNYQMGSIVAGLEADVSIASLKKTSLANAPGTPFSSKANWFATVAPRLGYSFGDALLYVKGGLAVADFEYSHLQGINLIKAGTTRAGYVVGAGLEYALTRNLSLKAEYNYMDFGKGRTTITGPGPTIWVTPKREIQTVKVGVNYRFGGDAGPITAKY